MRSRLRQRKRNIQKTHKQYDLVGFLYGLIPFSWRRRTWKGCVASCPCPWAQPRGTKARAREVVCLSPRRSTGAPSSIRGALTNQRLCELIFFLCPNPHCHFQPKHEKHERFKVWKKVFHKYVFSHTPSAYRPHPGPPTGKAGFCGLPLRPLRERYCVDYPEVLTQSKPYYLNSLYNMTKQPYYIIDQEF